MLQLLRAIARRDAATSKRLLEASPELALEALRVGATREDPKTYFLAELLHYVYAGDTALHVAAAAYDVAFARKLLKAGANPSARNRRGAEPLHYAADGNPGSEHWDPSAQAKMVELLIAKGGSPNALDKSGVAPLHRAVRTRSTGAVRALLLHGADPELENKSGSKPLDLATQDTGRSGSGSAAARKEQQAVMALLQALKPRGE